jgi:GPI-anchor transamidase subunit GAA1
MNRVGQWLVQLRQRLRDKDANLTRLKRRKALADLIYKRNVLLTAVLFTTGYLWLISTPSVRLDHKTYIDENALQPNQVLILHFSLNAHNRATG